MVTFYSFNRKSIIIAAGLLAIGVVVAVMLYGLFANKPKDTDMPPTPRNSSTEKVFIKDFYKFGDAITPTTRGRIESMLYNRVSESIPDLYTATIREGSYTKNTINQLTVQNFLVDVEPVGVTYLVVITNSRGNDSVDVRCPPKEKQIDQSATCKTGAMI